MTGDSDPFQYGESSSAAQARVTPSHTVVGPFSHADNTSSGQVSHASPVLEYTAEDMARMYEDMKDFLYEHWQGNEQARRTALERQIHELQTENEKVKRQNTQLRRASLVIEGGSSALDVDKPSRCDGLPRRNSVRG